MWRRGALAMLAATLACHHAPKPATHAKAHPPNNPGGFEDDGGGDLARQSIQVSVDTSVEDSDAAATTPANPRDDDRAARRYRRYNMEVDDPDPDDLAGMTYAGRSYATWHPPTVTGTVARTPHYTVGNDLRGAIVGTVTWGGGAVARLTTPCGTIDNPSVRTDANRGLADTVVYIEHVSVGRTPLPGQISHPIAIGGSVVRRGCTLLPTGQLATPLPVELAVHAEVATRVLVTTEATPIAGVKGANAGAGGTNGAKGGANGAKGPNAGAGGANGAKGVANGANARGGANAGGGANPTTYTFDVDEDSGEVVAAPPPRTDGKQSPFAPLLPGASKLLAIEAGGRALAQLPALGVTRVEAEDGAAFVPAWLLSIDSPYYAMTDDSGRFRLDDLAPGRYEITVWHAPVVTQSHGKLEWGAPLVARQTVAVGPSTPARATVVLGR